MGTVWIGLVGVGPLPGNTSLNGLKGAYVNALGAADSVEHFQQLVTDELRELKLFPFEFEDVEPFNERAARKSLSATLHSLAENSQRSGRIEFDTFHRFRNTDG
jgi:hypothetical protein